MNAPTQTTALYSSLASDPDLADIVALFVEEMPDRIATFLQHCESGDRESLRRAAHQLKGAAGSYGFDPISSVAGRLEGALRAGAAEERIHEGVTELVEMCRACRVGSGD